MLFMTLFQCNYEQLSTRNDNAGLVYPLYVINTMLNNVYSLSNDEYIIFQHVL